eukprot:1183581-Pleurochrysis_carterae.AAC.2
MQSKRVVRWDRSVRGDEKGGGGVGSGQVRRSVPFAVCNPMRTIVRALEHISKQGQNVRCSKQHATAAFERQSGTGALCTSSRLRSSSPASRGWRCGRRHTCAKPSEQRRVFRGACFEVHVQRAISIKDSPASARSATSRTSDSSSDLVSAARIGWSDDLMLKSFLLCPGALTTMVMLGWSLIANLGGCCLP